MHAPKANLPFLRVEENQGEVSSRPERDVARRCDEKEHQEE